MSINIITIDIDTERDEPIRLTKPEDFYHEGVDLDEILERDIKDMTLTSLYLSSMLTPEDEKKMLNNIERMILKRKDELTGGN